MAKSLRKPSTAGVDSIFGPFLPRKNLLDLLAELLYEVFQHLYRGHTICYTSPDVRVDFRFFHFFQNHALWLRSQYPYKRDKLIAPHLTCRYIHDIAKDALLCETLFEILVNQGGITFDSIRLKFAGLLNKMRRMKVIIENFHGEEVEKIQYFEKSREPGAIWRAPAVTGLWDRHRINPPYRPGED